MNKSVNIFQIIPFIRISSFFIIGILCSRHFPLSVMLGYIVIFLLLLIFLFFHKKTDYRSVSFSNYLLALLLVFSGYWYAHSKIKNANILPNKKTFYTATVLEQPIEKQKSYQTILRLKNPEKNIDTKVMSYFAKETNITNLYTGCKIIIFARPDSIKNRGNPFEFDYATYMQQQGIRYSVYLRSVDFKFLDTEELSLLIFAERCRNYLLSVLQKAKITGEEYTVVSALTLGYKKELDSEIKDYFASTGATHILAVSGLHVGIIYFLLSFLFAPLKRFKYGYPAYVLVVASFIWIYAFLTGLSPSVQRAAVMFSFILISDNLKRPTNIFNSLAASAFLLILCNPQIIYEIGFQLSYLAVTGIVLFQPLFYRQLSFKKWLPDKLWTLFTVSLAAQLSTFPIGLLYFSQFPVYFWMSNFVVIPAAIFILSGTILLFLVSFSNVCLYIAGWFVQGVTHVMLFLLKKIDALPFSLIENIEITPLQTIFLLVAIAFTYWFIIEKTVRELRLALLCMVIFSVLLCVNNIQLINQKKLIVYNTNYPVLHFINGRNNYVLYNARQTSANELFRLIDPVICHLKLTKPYVINSDLKSEFQNNELIISSNVINFLGNKIQMVTDNKKWLPAFCHVISNKYYLSDKKIKAYKNIVITGKTKGFKKQKSNIFFTSNNGAFVVDF